MCERLSRVRVLLRIFSSGVQGFDRGDAYYNRVLPASEMQLVNGGVRLAGLLNNTFTVSDSFLAALDALVWTLEWLMC